MKTAILVLFALLLAGCSPNAMRAFSSAANGATYGYNSIPQQELSPWYLNNVNNLNERTRPVNCNTYNGHTTCY